MFHLNSFLHLPLHFLHLKQIHCLLLTSPIFYTRRDLFLSRLIRRCTAATQFLYARRLLCQIQTPSIHLWDSLVGHFAGGITLSRRLSVLSYVQLRRNGVFPSRHTFPPLLKAVFRLMDSNPFQFHAHIFKFGLDSHLFVRNSLISGYCNRGLFDCGYRVFDGTEDKDVVSWTAMIDGFVRNGSASEAIAYFVEMKKTGIAANEMTVVSVLSAAAKTEDVRFGRSIHGFYLETGRVKCDVFIGSSLVDMYGKCGFYDDAQKVFDEMPSRNVVTWTALIAGYVQSRCFDKGLFLFQEMLESDVTPNEKTLSSVLSACAHVGALHQGRRVHCYMIKNLIEINTTLGTTLIDLYAKCGYLEEARLVFERLYEKNVYSWTAMINGFAAHGYARGALDHFQTMLRSHVLPNEVTFIAVLSACAHGGLVEEGRRLFLSMKERLNLEPNVDHYACMVDLLGRKGLLEEAKALIERMPMKPTNAVWGALFGACLIHKDYELGKYAASRVIKLQPSHSGRYTLLANLYSESQNWNDVARVRKQMKDQQMVKSPGCSWIEVKGKLHEFIAFDTKKCVESDDLFKTLDNAGMQMRLRDELEDFDLITLL
ncbi:hypothetical protein EUTSA_v10011334mg [Eutrema salsugineum]|uniref:DYW domain-containing protein n=1 Tax=Eutrema salsugineum TaxID=72664 RepID=V4MGJ2_EUTSA|nr:pentatricopeptide repeat-containing protein At1g50270 [Eutrema salsugineum]ESQ30451.1 hypothetical protein EUTSA_v10011334mg [Eutrema salsugineum]